MNSGRKINGFPRQTLMSMISAAKEKSLTIVRFCAKECHRQQSGELSVSLMFEAYQFALQAMTDFIMYGNTISLNETLIQSLAAIIEPRNEKGYRLTPVRFANGSVLTNANLIPQQMKRLVEFQAEMNPQQFYKEFQKIHPFEDGNGRVGVILFNWLNKSLDEPTIPSEAFHE